MAIDALARVLSIGGVLLFIVADGATAQTAAPVFTEGGFDAAEYGAGEGYPVGQSTVLADKRFLVGTYSHFGDIVRTRSVARAPSSWSFRRASVEAAVSYDFRNAHY